MKNIQKLIEQNTIKISQNGEHVWVNVYDHKTQGMRVIMQEYETYQLAKDGSGGHASETVMLTRQSGSDKDIEVVPLAVVNEIIKYMHELSNRVIIAMTDKS